MPFDDNATQFQPPIQPSPCNRFQPLLHQTTAIKTETPRIKVEKPHSPNARIDPSHESNNPTAGNHCSTPPPPPQHIDDFHQLHMESVPRHYITPYEQSFQQPDYQHQMRYLNEISSQQYLIEELPNRMGYDIPTRPYDSVTPTSANYSTYLPTSISTTDSLAQHQQHKFMVQSDHQADQQPQMSIMRTTDSANYLGPVYPKAIYQPYESHGFSVMNLTLKMSTQAEPTTVGGSTMVDGSPASVEPIIDLSAASRLKATDQRGDTAQGTTIGASPLGEASPQTLDLRVGRMASKRRYLFIYVFKCILFLSFFSKPIDR